MGSKFSRRTLAAYVRAEDALHAFLGRNISWLCALCAHRTAFLTANGLAAGAHCLNCCNENHAIESMNPDTLAGTVARAQYGERWWVNLRSVPPCRALTAHGCFLERGRPLLCNRFFCEAVRDYLWLLGGQALAKRLDTLQEQWISLYRHYSRPGLPGRFLALLPGWDLPTRALIRFLAEFEADLHQKRRPITLEELERKLFKDTETYPQLEAILREKGKAVPFLAL